MASRLVLVLGDLFIPDRALDIPTKFKKLLTPGKIGQILCLGNLTDATTYEYLRGLAPDLQLVRGDFDFDLPTPTTIPMLKVIQLGNNIRIGITHGHTIIPLGDPDALLTQARQMDVDVLLWCAGTGRFEAYELEGKFFVNPGSVTGALSTGWVEKDELTAEGGSVPSFVLMDVQGDVLVLYVYQLKEGPEGPVSVEKVSYRKGGEGSEAG